ncbi:hypothetical protein [Paenibacillus glycanilyticus]|nr:hypothetical protein [Paenibacillus glycanilyticus]
MIRNRRQTPTGPSKVIVWAFVKWQGVISALHDMHWKAYSFSPQAFIRML